MNRNIFTCILISLYLRFHENDENNDKAPRYFEHDFSVAFEDARLHNVNHLKKPGNKNQILMQLICNLSLVNLQYFPTVNVFNYDVTINSTTFLAEWILKIYRKTL